MILGQFLGVLDLDSLIVQRQFEQTAAQMMMDFFLSRLLLISYQLEDSIHELALGEMIARNFEAIQGLGGPWLDIRSWCKSALTIDTCKRTRQISISMTSQGRLPRVANRVRAMFNSTILRSIKSSSNLLMYPGALSTGTGLA